FLGAIMGYFVGQAVFDPSRRKRLLLAAYFVPVFFHGLYDFPLLTLKHLPASGPALPRALILGLLLVTLAALIAQGAIARKLVKRLRNEQLGLEAAVKAARALAPLAGAATMPMSAVAEQFVVTAQPMRASGMVLCGVGGVLITAASLAFLGVVTALTHG